MWGGLGAGSVELGWFRLVEWGGLGRVGVGRVCWICDLGWNGVGRS